MRPVFYFIAALDYLILAYVSLFFLINSVLLVIAFVRVRRELRAEHSRTVASDTKEAFLPSVSLLVPAYNEEVTIVESLRSLLALDYPNYEIIICNDGSKDRTVEVVRSAFALEAVDMEVPDLLSTQAVRGYYEKRTGLPPSVRRMVLIDKDNGGKADALNAAINLAEGELVTSMDADSLLVPDALRRAAVVFSEDPVGIVGVGAQIGISNGSVVSGGKVTELRLPKRWISRFQIVEYMRSFVQGRTALSAINAVLILSGVFSLLRRDLVVETGGYLTRNMRSRIGLEYCGKGAHTVCEDMEIVVRIHRYLKDKGLPGRVVSLPFPAAWTEAPEVYPDLGKQRARWYRGLLEVLLYHRTIIFSPRFAQIGLFSLPYQLVFEALAPILEVGGYVLLLLTVLLNALSMEALASFVAFAMACNLLLSSLSVLLCVYSERATTRRGGQVALFAYDHLRDAFVLILAGALSNLGYRQYLLGWQIKGLIDFLKGHKGWDKLERKGFTPTSSSS